MMKPTNSLTAVFFAVVGLRRKGSTTFSSAGVSGYLVMGFMGTARSAALVAAALAKLGRARIKFESV